MEDEILGFTTVLPVAEDPGGSYELELPPANGLDYLRRVRLEAMSCPATVTVEIKELPPQPQKLCSKDRQLSRTSAIANNHVALCSPAPTGYAPSMQWQRRQVAAFSQVRMRLCQEMKVIKKSKGRTAVNKLPTAADVSGWCKLCFGKFDTKVSSRIAEINGIAQDNMDQSQNSMMSISNQSEECSSFTPPLLSVISYIDQDTLLAVLDYHINWFEATGFTHLQGQWFYALLAALEKPLLPESCSLIRTLARICSNLRASLESSDDDLLPQLNLLICLVSRYFEQSDMADSEVDALSHLTS